MTVLELVLLTGVSAGVGVTAGDLVLAGCDVGTQISASPFGLPLKIDVVMCETVLVPFSGKE